MRPVRRRQRRLFGLSQRANSAAAVRLYFCRRRERGSLNDLDVNASLEGWGLVVIYKYRIDHFPASKLTETTFITPAAGKRRLFFLVCLSPGEGKRRVNGIFYVVNEEKNLSKYWAIESLCVVEVTSGRGEIGAGAAAPVQVWACGPSSLHGSAASRELRVIFGAGRQTENRGIRSFAPLMFLGRLLSCLQLGSKASLLKFRTRTRLGNS